MGISVEGLRYRLSGVMPSIKTWEIPSTPEERSSMIASAFTKINQVPLPLDDDSYDSGEYLNALAALSDAKYYTRRYLAVTVGHRDIMRIMVRVDQANYLSGFSVRINPS